MYALEVCLLDIVKILCIRSHEDMSVKMVDHIVNQHHIEIDSEMVKRVKVGNLLPDRTCYRCIILFEVLSLASSRLY